MANRRLPRPRRADGQPSRALEGREVGARWRRSALPAGEAALTVDLLIAAAAAPRGWAIVPRLGTANPRSRLKLRAADWRLVQALHAASLGVMLVELLTPEEARDSGSGFQAGRLGARLAAATRWLLAQPEAQGQRVGYLAGGLAAGAALWAAADLPGEVAGVASLEGRPDLAARRLGQVTAPVLLLASRRDRLALGANRDAHRRLNGYSRLVVAPSFQRLRVRPNTPGAVETALATDWLADHLLGPAAPPHRRRLAALPAGRAAAAATVLALAGTLAGPAAPAEAAASTVYYDDSINALEVRAAPGTANTIEIWREVDSVVLAQRSRYWIRDTAGLNLDGSASGVGDPCNVHDATTVVCTESYPAIGRPDWITRVTLNAGDGDDALTLQALADPMTVNGSTGADTVYVNGSGPGPLTVNLGDGNDTANVRALQSPTTVNTGTGTDTINVSSNAPTNTGHISNIAASITAHNADGGNDVLAVSDYGSTAVRNAIWDTNVDRADFSPVFSLFVNGSAFAGGLSYTSGTANDTVTVRSTQSGEPLSVHSSGGTDTVNVGSAGRLSGINGALYVNNDPYYTHLYLDDSANTSASSATLATQSLAGLSPATISWDTSDVAHVGLSTGSGADTVTVTGSWGRARDVSTGGGTDTLAMGSGAWVSDGVLNTGSADDWIDYSAWTSVVSVNLDAGVVSGSSAPSAGIDHVIGGSGNDTLMGRTGQTNFLYGGGGIDYTAMSGDTNFTLTDTYLTRSGVDTDYLNSIERAQVSLTGTGRTINASSFTGATTLIGGAGNDSIQGGAGPDSILGGDGNDSIYANAGNDTLNAGAGNDLFSGGFGNDSLEDGGDNDTLYEYYDTSFTLTNNQLTSPALGTDTLALSPGVDAASLRGGASANTLDASAATVSVTLRGEGGDDVIAGGTANDSLDGGAGTDRLVATRGAMQLRNDRFETPGLAELDLLSSIETASLTGTAGNDWIEALTFTIGPVTLVGLAGNDSLGGSPNNDLLQGGDGNDALHGNDGDDVIAGGPGDDSLWGGAGLDTTRVDVDYGNVTLNDTLVIGEGNDFFSSMELVWVQGGIGANLLDAAGYSSVVTLDGGGGNDTLVAGPGGGSIGGGAGTDRLVVSADANLTVAADAAGNGTLSGYGTFTLSGIEQASLTGGASPNALNASNFAAGPATLVGLAGADILTGGSGNDRLEGGDDGDVLIGNAGNNTLEGGSGPDSLIAGTGNDQLVGGSEDDTFVGAGGSDTIDGGEGANDLLRETGDVNFTLTNASLTGLGTTSLSNVELVWLADGASSHTLNASGFSGKTTLDAGGGNDSVLGGSGDDSILGGAGNDSLAGNAGSDTLLAGAGNDTLDGGDDHDRLLGEEGDDQLAGGLGNDILDGGPHVSGDSAGLSIGSASVTLDGSSMQGQGDDVMTNIEHYSVIGGGTAQTIDASGFGYSITIDGGGGNDTLLGSPYADNITGSDGDDSVVGNGGDDTLHGGAGDDTVAGGPGNDSLLGGPGSADVVKAAGDVNFVLTPTLLTGLGVDTLAGLEQANLTGSLSPNSFDVSAFGGYVVLDGAGENDLFYLGIGGGSVTGGTGIDRLWNSGNVNFELSDTLLAGAGTYELNGVEQAQLQGGAGANELNALNFTGQVTLLGDAGDDTLSSGLGADCLNGGEGVDLWVEAGNRDVRLVGTGAPGEIVDTVSNIEYATIEGGDQNNTLVLTGFRGVATLRGLAGDDFLTGGDFGDLLEGGLGNDTLTGQAANDTLDGGPGTDRLVGGGDVSFTLSDSRLDGTGQDTLANLEEAVLTGGPGASHFNATAFSHPVTLLGLEGPDTLLGGLAVDSIEGAEGDDSLGGGGANDILSGGPGNDIMAGDAGDDYLDGVTGNDTLRGGDGQDTLIGAEGHDVMDGGAGDDLLSASFDADPFGGPYDDTLTGGPGKDTMEGGPGSDLLLETGDVNYELQAASLLGGLGEDVFSSIERANLAGGDGANNLLVTTFAGPVTLSGGRGDDTLTASFNDLATDDSLSGGEGNDLVVAARDVSWLLTDNLLAGWGNDTLHAIERAVITAGDLPNTLDASAFTGRVTLDAAGGDDSLLGASGSDSLIGGDGNDTLVGGTGDDTVLGGAGADRLYAGLGHDSVEGGGEDDTLTGDLGDDILLGGAGTNHLIEASLLNEPIAYTLTNTSLVGLGTDVLSNTTWVTMTLGPGNNLFDAATFTGTVSVDGQAGNDTFTGGTGNDTLAGGDGIDRVVEIGDTNWLLTNTHLAGYSADALSGFEEAHLTAGDLPNTLDASAFSGSVTLIGLGGNDSLLGASGSDSLIGGTGHDTLAGGAGDDTLAGGEGNDSLAGGEGIDSITGSAGGDTISGGPGDDVMIGGDGLETDRLVEVGDVDFTLTNNLLNGLGADQASGFEQAHLTGGPSGNRLYTADFAGPVTLLGEGGPDTLVGGPAADSLSGGAANDWLTGGLGADIIRGGTSGDIDRLIETRDANLTLTSAQLTIWPPEPEEKDQLEGIDEASLTGGAGNNIITVGSTFLGPVTLNGAAGNDSLLGGAYSDSLVGGPGADTVRGQAGLDTLDGGADRDLLIEFGNSDFVLTDTQLTSASPLGPDTLSNFELASLTGGSSNNVLDASAFNGPVTLDGGEGNDRLIGAAFNDNLRGGPGDDTLTGGPGDDTVSGGAGFDLLIETADGDYVLTDASLVGLGGNVISEIEAVALTGGPGDNRLDASSYSGTVTLAGLGGNDTLIGTARADWLQGGDGNDALTGGLGDDLLEGGTGIDLVAEAGDVSFTLTDVSLTGVGTDNLNGLEQASLLGGASDNTFDLTGWSGQATVSGGPGADLLAAVAGAGDDVLAVGPAGTTQGDRLLAYIDVEALRLDGREGNDNFNLSALGNPAGTPFAEASTATALAHVTLLGGPGDDVFELVPLSAIDVVIDGGDHAAGDTLNLNAAPGLAVSSTEGTLAPLGMRPVQHTAVEFVNVLSRYFRLLLSYVRR